MKTQDQLVRYNEYEIEDFLSDEFFIDWVKNPNDDNCHFWDIWLQKNPDRRNLIQEAATFIRSFSYASNPQLSDQEYLDIFEKVIKSPAPIQKKEDKSESWLEKFRVIFPLPKIAATVLMSFVAWVAVEVYWIGAVVEEPTVTAEWIEKSTPKGIKSTFFLSDGTKITLNSESKLMFPKLFDVTKRRVEIEGEAFFEVVKDGRPFTVSVGENDINVLGTSFNVKEDGDGIAVALVEGKVRVNDKKGNQVLLDPNEMLVIQEGGKFYKSGFDPMEITGWKEMYLIFNKSSFEETISKLENWYGVEIEVQGEFESNWSYSGTYKEESLENVLRGISYTSGLRYELKDKKVKLTKL